MKINREELQTALASIKPGLASKEIIQQSTTVVFAEGKIISFNDSIMVSVPTELKLNGAVPADELYALVSKAKDEVLSVRQKGDIVTVKGKRFEASIVTETEIHLPLSEVKSPGKWGLVPKNLLTAIKFCLPSVSRDMTKLALANVNIGTTFVEGCDGYRLTRYELDGTIKKGFMIPGSSAKELAGVEVVRYSLTEGWVHFKTKENVVLSCRVGMGKYVDTTDILTPVKSISIQFPEGLPGMLDRAKVMAETDLTREAQVTVEMDDGSLVVSSSGPRGKFTETCDIEGKQKFEFDIDPDSFIEILKHVDKARYATDGKKIVFESKGEFTHVLPLV